MQYEEFLRTKQQRPDYQGFDIDPNTLNPALFPFQRDIVTWALKLGKAAIFAERGLGKTLMEAEWAKHVAAHTGKPVLILTPLAVAPQHIREGAKFGISMKQVRSQEEVGDAQIVVCNYESLHKLDAESFGGVALDESSILKAFTGKTKQQIIEAFAHTPYKLAATATPAPNDHLELGNHAAFLNIMPANEMISRWFINDSNKAGNYRLKQHAIKDYWRWVTSWAVCISHPRDLGEQYDMQGYDLPPLHFLEHFIPANEEAISEAWAEGRLLPNTAPSGTALHSVKRLSLADRIAKAKEIMAQISPDEPVLIWCDTNDEADALKAAFPEATEIRGNHTAQQKEDAFMGFADGSIRVLITKPDIAGFGMNWQHCRYMLFIGVSYSFEKTYQALGRSYRFGQKREVFAHIIYAETEGSVLSTLQRKQSEFQEMQRQMNQAMKEHGLFRDQGKLQLTSPEVKSHNGTNFTMWQGDCVPVTRDHIADNSLHFSVYSPPFAHLYIYSDAEADMGNSTSTEEFIEHYEYIVQEIYRATVPGRLTAVHCKDLPVYKNKAGWHGIEDFSGAIRDVHLRNGWVFHSRVTIWKDPVNEMQKTNSHGLLHRNFAKNTQVVRQGLPDYLLIFAKPDPEGAGENVQQLRKQGDYIGTNPPQSHEIGRRASKPSWYGGTVEDYDYSIAVWQRYASPVWFDIDQTRCLNEKVARGDQDEKHLCPLQLDVIERAIDLWSNPGDTVFSPFAGIGSEGYGALSLNRRFIGVELKPEYFNFAVKYLEDIERQKRQPTLFDLLPVAEAGSD